MGMSEDVQKRVFEHNKGSVRSTKSRKPYILVYAEELENRSQARTREKYLKSAAGRKYLRKLNVRK